MREPGANLRAARLTLAVAVMFVSTSSLAKLDAQTHHELDSPTHRARSVLLVSIDSLRADRLGAYGNPRATSPTLDHLAAEGVRFANVASSTSWTLPAHVTLLSGQMLRSHQVLTATDRIRAPTPLLAEQFHARGYETIGLFSGPFLDPAYGFARGFDRYESCQGELSGASDKRGTLGEAASQKTGPLIEAAFDRWLAARRGKRPFFAFVHMWDVHYDYIPPQPYASMFDPDYHGALDGRQIMGSGFPNDASPRDVQHLLALYDGEIRSTDGTIAHLLKALERAGLLDETLVVVTSDHGDEFHEHGGKGHMTSLYEELIHIPLILWARSGLPRGRVVDPPASLADVAPTILDAIGLPAMPGADGSSLMARAEGRADTAPPALSELFNAFTGELLALSLRDRTSKVIYRLHVNARVQWQTFDLVGDPREQTPTLVGSRLLQQQFLTEQRAAHARAAERKAARIPLPPDVQERLRALGYLR